MSYSIDDMERKFEELVKSFTFVSADNIPKIDLYMDQVTTFMEQYLSGYARDPENDKILTKTMINNYTKNKVLIPPVRKKYGMDHMIILLFIYYLKSFLSLEDIRKILQPLEERYCMQQEGDHKAEKNDPQKEAGKEQGDHEPPARTLEDIYNHINAEVSDQMKDLNETMHQQFEKARESFQDAEGEEKKRLQQFDLICRAAADIYIRQLFIERMIDCNFEDKEH